MKTEIKKFILFIIKFCAVLGAACGGYFLLFWFLWEADFGPDAYSEAYQNALLKQYQALEASEREPEVIVFGSSYVPFSIDVNTLEPLLGEEVQTLGVEASIGIPFLVDVLYETAKPGDTIVYMLGKSNWYDEDFMVISAALESDKTKLLNYWSNRSPSALKRWRTKMIWRKLYALTVGPVVQWTQEKLSKKPQVYSLSSFDEQGNMTAVREGCLISQEVTPSDTLGFDEMELETLDMLNEFSGWCRENDITFVICYAPTIDGSLAESPEDLAEYHQQMLDYMESDILLTPQDYFLPVTDFYNHIAHPNTEGAEKYSAILGEALIEYKQNGQMQIP